MATKQVSGLVKERGLRERSPGVFELRVFDAATGKQVSRTYRAPRAEPGAGVRAARAELAKLRTQVAGGEHGPATRSRSTTVGELLGEWLAHCAAVGREQTTLNGYRVRAQQLTTAIGTTPLTRLSIRHVEQLYDRWRNDGMSSATVLHHHRVLRAALSLAERWGYVDRNVAKLADVPGSVSAALAIPTAEQARTLVIRASTSTAADLGPIILFSMLVGCRRGELCGLRWSDVDWDRHTLTIERSVWEVSSKWGLKSTKTRQRRCIALDPATIGLLAGRRERAEADAQACGIDLPLDAYIWSTYPDGHAPRTPDYVTRSFAALCRELQAEADATGRRESWRFRFHDLRHLSATEMIGSGVDVRTVASRLGHADPTVTLPVYAHPLEERDQQAAEGLGRRLAPPAGEDGSSSN